MAIIDSWVYFSISQTLGHVIIVIIRVLPYKAFTLYKKIQICNDKLSKSVVKLN